MSRRAHVTRKVSMSTVIRLAAAVGLLACSEGAREEVFAPPDGVAGIYFLQTVRDQAPPVTLIDENGYRLEVLAGRYDLAASGTYTSSLTIRETIQTAGTPSSSTYDERRNGAYSIAAQIVRFTNPLGGDETAVLTGSTLSFAGTLPRVYAK